MNSLQTLQAQPIIPYNVLANPLSGNADAQPGSLGDLIASLKEAWVEFQKTGSDKLLQSVLQNGFSAASGGSFNYLAVLQAVIGVLSTVLGAEIPGVAVAAPILSMVIGWIWPSKKKDETQQLINLIDAEIQKQLNQALSNQDKNDWTGYLNAIFQISHDAARAVVDAQFTGSEGDTNRQPRTPGVSDYENVYNHLLATTGSLIVALSQMINGNFDTLAIPFFVIGATVQLSTYQTFIQFANKWLPIVYPDYQTQGTAGYTQQQNLINAKSDMRAAIHDHTQKVFNAFKTGMPSLGSDKNSVNAYNRYVRGMVLNGLDMLATWPSMYPDDYPSQTELEQTRVIFSDLVGKDQTVNNAVTLINMVDKSGPDAWNQHSSIDINSISYTRRELQQVQFPIHDGNRGNTTNCYPYAVILNYPDNSYFYGDLYAPQFSGNPTFGGDNDILTALNARTQHTRYVDSESLQMNCYPYASNDCHILGYCTGGTCLAPSGCSDGYGKSCNETLPDQKINALYPFRMDLGHSGTPDKLGVMSSHVPFNLIPNNVFGAIDSDTNNIIGKGFPAEKGYWSNGGDRPIPSSNIAKEWVNGANAVKVEYGAFLAMKATNMKTGKYYIRVRYANPSNKDVNMWQEVWAGNQKLQGGGWTFKSTSDDNVADNFPKQVYVTGQQGDPLNLPSGEIMVKLSGQNSGDSIYVDRIEFIPISETENINYMITSTVPLLPSGQYVPSLSNYPTIWTADSGQQAISATLTFSGLNSTLFLLAKTNPGDDNDENNWDWMCPDGFLGSVLNGTYTFPINNHDSACAKKPFTAIKIGAELIPVSAGTITGSITHQR
ncbi:insecticidal delta-endotoxin Cry8Ea1 family protein [Bacillus thuringiensis]|uniref:insecticidal delta-endotoxin Cry8Ea1 family protein n=1 Tax=Bacillus thuringiensis TaxID=1428 RepID=UPI00090238D9|nr:insecticidal delta-endotoxin Cry8Ea1 family protein [Bacillus thuringiensis]PGW42274.1 hypothetical protein COE03_24015 [Bacillus thuringiensis]